VDVGTRELVTCPECGATQDVQLNRRDAVDFCRRCDFPLFWAPQRVTRDRDVGGEAESLRRLPGTVGRTMLASVRCPHCAEPNTVSAVVCVRCGLSMHPVAPPPPPVVTAPPPPEPVIIEPERVTPWWVWLVIAFGAGAVAMVVLTLTGVIF
jgi:Zn ribbon nucleic-acid-binding protein